MQTKVSFCSYKKIDSWVIKNTFNKDFELFVLQKQGYKKVKRNEKVYNNKDIHVKVVFMKELEIEFQLSSTINPGIVKDVAEAIIQNGIQQEGSNAYIIYDSVKKSLYNKENLSFEELQDVCSNNNNEKEENINIESEIDEKCNGVNFNPAFTDANKKGVSLVDESTDYRIQTNDKDKECEILLNLNRKFNERNKEEEKIEREIEQRDQALENVRILSAPENDPLIGNSKIFI